MADSLAARLVEKLAAHLVSWSAALMVASRVGNSVDRLDDKTVEMSVVPKV